ncbi:unnamed protein product [Durusdinium trenchii]|uniref:Uncharacterized protein n=1 Tax=Durusdinium trenchii TaxID=1381693 RepID=A0ABP0MT58_9DINO
MANEVNSPDSPGHLWSLPVLLQAAARGKPSGCEDELNTDNEQELLQKGRRAAKAKELNTDNEAELLRRVQTVPKEEACYKEVVQKNPSESLGQLVHFAEGLCRHPPVIGRSHERLGSVLSPPVLEPTTIEAAEASAEESASVSGESAKGQSIGDPEVGCANHEPDQCKGNDMEGAEASNASGNAASPINEARGKFISQMARGDLSKEVPPFPALSPDQAKFTNEAGVEGYSETVSEISGNHSLDLCFLRRADCRFTQAGAAWFCGMRAGYIDFECYTAEVCGRERSFLQQIFEAVDDSIDAVWNARGARERERASDDFPLLLANLSTHLRIYHFQLKEKGCIDTLDGRAVILELLSRLVEVLDTLAPLEGGHAATAVPCLRELACDALNEALGSRGFLPLCISYITESTMDIFGRDLALELSMHALMAIQLSLLWFPPTRITLPEETFIDMEGYECVLSVAADLITQFEEEPWDFLGLERLALAMDILRIGMRSNAGIDHVCAQSDASEAPTVAPLALRALQTLAFTALEDRESKAALAALPAAVRIMGALIHVTPIARAMNLGFVVQALRQALQCRPLSLPLAVAFRDLVLRERPRHWFSQGQEAARVRGDFYRYLHSENVLNELAIAATDRVEELMDSLQKKRQGGTGPNYVPCRNVVPCGTREMAVESLEEAVIIGAYYDCVEAAVLAVYGKTSRVDAQKRASVEV